MAILYSHENIESQISILNAELQEVSNWFKANKLSVNASKTKIMGTYDFSQSATWSEYNSWQYMHRQSEIH